jgi:hypothetical protein
VSLISLRRQETLSAHRSPPSSTEAGAQELLAKGLQLEFVRAAELVQIALDWLH